MRYFLLFLFNLSLFTFPQKLTSPKANDVIRTSVIRLSLAISDTTNVAEVRYYNFSFDNYTIFQIPEYELLSIVKKPPFDYYWDIRDLPDLDQHRLGFYADVVTKEGVVLSGAKVGVPPGINGVVIDRSPSERLATAVATQQAVKDRCWYTFLSGMDSTTFSLSYTDDSLFIDVIVQDDSIVSHYSPDKQISHPMFLDDYLNFSFDTRCDRSPRIDSNDFMVWVNPFGVINFSDIRNSPWLDTFNIVRVNSKRSDHGGYELSMALPWSLLNVKPTANLKMGFNCLRTDKDADGEGRIWGTFSGSDRLQGANTSEWGSIVLEKRPLNKFYYIIMSTIILSITLLFRKFFRIKTQTTSLNPQGVQFNEYLQKHYQEVECTLETVAAYFKMSKGYFGRLYKESTGLSFSQALNNLRIDAAIKKLVESDEQVTQIAYSVGYDNFHTFLAAFKRATGKTPSDLRSRSQSKL